MSMVTGTSEISPHGGRLIDRVLGGDALAAARELVSSLTRLALNARMMSDVELLAVGAYSPLEGFMGQADYRGVLRDMRLANGLPWTLPITLAVRKAAADQLREGQDVALVAPWEEPLAILHLEERFPYDGREEARLVYGTDDRSVVELVRDAIRRVVLKPQAHRSGCYLGRPAKAYVYRTRQRSRRALMRQGRHSLSTLCLTLSSIHDAEKSQNAC